MVVYAFNPSIKEAEACGSLSLRPALSTEEVTGQAPKTQRGNTGKKKPGRNNTLPFCLSKTWEIQSNIYQ